MQNTVTRPTTIYAAGAVLWRESGVRADGVPSVEVAVVHRPPRYDDWSLPKGKVDPGETEPVTAVREILEETGYACQLGRRLAAVTYPVVEDTKKVQYWAARTLDGEFIPNDEVDQLLWLPAAEALERLHYPPHDRKVLRRFTKVPAHTSTVLIVRHGRAAGGPGTRATTGSARWTSTVAHRPNHWWDSCLPSAAIAFSPRRGPVVIRHSLPWPRNSVCRSTTSRHSPRRPTATAAAPAAPACWRSPTSPPLPAALR